MVIIGANLAICFTKLYKLKNLASKINKNCIAIVEYCAPKFVFGPGKLSGVSRNGPLDPDWVIQGHFCQKQNTIKKIMTIQNCVIIRILKTVSSFYPLMAMLNKTSPVYLTRGLYTVIISYRTWQRKFCYTCYCFSLFSVLHLGYVIEHTCAWITVGCWKPSFLITSIM